MDSLTKENFWNELYAQYPSEMEVFCKWIDEYKKRVNWNQLFNSDSNWQDSNGKNATSPKFHEIPIAMQLGIFAHFLADQEKDTKIIGQLVNNIKEYFKDQHESKNE